MPARLEIQKQRINIILYPALATILFRNQQLLLATIQIAWGFKAFREVEEYYTVNAQIVFQVSYL